MSTAKQLADVGIGVDPNSLRTTDTAVLNAISFLESLGAPTPVSVDMVVPYPGGQAYANSQLQWGELTFSAGLTACWPLITAGLLGANGIIKLPPNFTTSGYAPYQMAVMDPPVPTPPPATVPTDPIGPKIYPSTPDLVGDQYYTAPHETYLPGGQYTNPTTGWSFVKISVANPFGNSVYWIRTK